MPLQRSPAEIIAAAHDALKNDLRKCVPATVTAVYPARQTVDVQVAITNVLFDDLGNVLEEDPISLSDVPLGIMRGGGFFVWVPVQPGDSVLLVFSDLSADTWRAGDGSPHPPGWVGKHTMDSPFAMPMFAPDAKFFSDPNADPSKVIIGKDGSAAQIRISATDIELGNAVNDAIALASKVDLFIQTVMGWLPVPNDGGAALKTALTGAGFTTLSTTKSTLVKAQ